MPGIFPPLHDVLGIGEVAAGAGMVEMQVRMDDVFDVGRIEAGLRETVHATVFRIHERVIDIGDIAPVADRIERGFDGDTAVDDDIAARMGDQEPRNGGVEFTLARAQLDVDFLLADTAGLEEVELDILSHVNLLGEFRNSV